VPEHKIVGAINADAPKRFTKQFLPLSLPTTELVQEVLEIAGRRLFVPLQPKQPRAILSSPKESMPSIGW
jgi:hypothetical protein